jgi:hypothetical protein
MANSLQAPFSKITTAKWTGGVAKVAKCLLCKGKAMRSNPSPTKKEKNVLKTTNHRAEKWTAWAVPGGGVSWADVKGEEVPPWAGRWAR